MNGELKPELFDRIQPNEIPYLTNIQPSGEYVTEMMWFAGGVPVQWYLRDYLDLDVLTVTGRTLGDSTGNAPSIRLLYRNHGYLNNYKSQSGGIVRKPENATKRVDCGTERQHRA